MADNATQPSPNVRSFNAKRQAPGFAPPNAKQGFTLIETLVALIIFGIISVAISLSFSTALKTQEVNNRRQEELGSVRAIFDSLTRDIQAASVSANNQSGIFSTSSTGRAAKTERSVLLILSTRSGNLQDSSSGANSGGVGFGVQSSQNASGSPQSDLAMVRYEFDPSAHTLKRTISSVPSLDSLESASANSGVIGTGIVSISLRFWDTENSSYRSDWGYEQKNQATAADPSSSSGSTSGGKTIGLGEGGAGGAGSSGSGDAILPGHVEVQLELKLKDGTIASYKTDISVVSSSPQSNEAPPLSEERINAAKAAMPSSSGSSTRGPQL